MKELEGIHLFGKRYNLPSETHFFNILINIKSSFFEGENSSRISISQDFYVYSLI